MFSDQSISADSSTQSGYMDSSTGPDNFAYAETATPPTVSYMNHMQTITKRPRNVPPKTSKAISPSRRAFPSTPRLSSQGNYVQTSMEAVSQSNKASLPGDSSTIYSQSVADIENGYIDNPQTETPAADMAAMPVDRHVVQTHRSLATSHGYPTHQPAIGNGEIVNRVTVMQDYPVITEAPTPLDNVYIGQPAGVTPDPIKAVANLVDAAIKERQNANGVYPKTPQPSYPTPDSAMSAESTVKQKLTNQPVSIIPGKSGKEKTLSLQLHRTVTMAPYTASVQVVHDVKTKRFESATQKPERKDKVMKRKEDTVAVKPMKPDMSNMLEFKDVALNRIDSSVVKHQSVHFPEQPVMLGGGENSLLKGFEIPQRKDMEVQPVMQVELLAKPKTQTKNGYATAVPETKPYITTTAPVKNTWIKHQPITVRTGAPTFNATVRPNIYMPVIPQGNVYIQPLATPPSFTSKNTPPTTTTTTPTPTTPTTTPTTTTTTVTPYAPPVVTARPNAVNTVVSAPLRRGALSNNAPSDNIQNLLQRLGIADISPGYVQSEPAQNGAMPRPANNVNSNSMNGMNNPGVQAVSGGDPCGGVPPVALCMGPANMQCGAGFRCVQVDLRFGVCCPNNQFRQVNQAQVMPAAQNTPGASPCGTTPPVSTCLGPGNLQCGTGTYCVRVNAIFGVCCRHGQQNVAQIGAIATASNPDSPCGGAAPQSMCLGPLNQQCSAGNTCVRVDERFGVCCPGASAVGMRNSALPAQMWSPQFFRPQMPGMTG